MKNMDITKATVGNLDDLISIKTLKTSGGSPSSSRDKGGMAAGGSGDPLPVKSSGSEQLSQGDRGWVWWFVLHYCTYMQPYI